MVLGIAFGVVSVLLISALFGWSAHVAEKNVEIESLRQDIKDRDAAITVANRRVQNLNSERVPLRTKCRCKHDAYQHSNRGCNVDYPFGWSCSCLASQEQVLYDPEPIRKMIGL